MPQLPQPSIPKNDKKAGILIGVVTVLVLLMFGALSRITIESDPGFDPHVFASVNAVINSIVTLVLIAAFIMVRKGNYALHRKLMIAAIILSCLFLLSYVAHHLFAGDTKLGDLNHDGLLSPEEKDAVGNTRYFYYFLLLTHIPLAALFLPFILFTAYRALSGSYVQHRKIARITLPIWLYVTITGVLLYLMIKPYY